jgi:hypothetical protein
MRRTRPPSPVLQLSALLDIVDKVNIISDIGDSNMSDGPFACIKMRKPWRDLLEKADNHNFGADELRRDLGACLHGDWTGDVERPLLGKVRQIMDNAAQSSLFGNEGIRQLEAVRKDTAGSALAELFVDCAIQALREGHTSTEGTSEAVTNASTEWLNRSFRGVEEHCINENVERARALGVRARLNAAAAGTVEMVVHQVLGLTPAEKVEMPSKQRGLDEGVPINGKR